MNVEFYEPAFIEYREAIDFYNLQSDRLGDKFIIEIDKTLTIIKNYPDSFPKYTSQPEKP
jgi:hypothetical protein